LNQLKIIKVLGQAKYPEAMLAANIDIFEMNHESKISHFNILENLEKGIICTIGTASTVEVQYF
jgi:hypothetical protein